MVKSTNKNTPLETGAVCTLNPDNKVPLNTIRIPIRRGIKDYKSDVPFTHLMIMLGSTSNKLTCLTTLTDLPV
jgi:hypothetical protein